MRNNSRIADIEMAYPDDNQPLGFIRYMRSQLPQLKVEVTDEQLSLMTSGLNRVHLNSLLRSAATESEGLTLDGIRRKKKELIEAETVGLVEFVQPQYGLES